MRLVLIEPDPRLAGRALGVAVVRADAHQLPIATGSIDTVVLTLVLCSVADPHRVLTEIRRVLRPHGQLLLLEHVRSPHPVTARWQHWLTPAWRRVAGDCHLDRDTRTALRTAGFDDSALSSCRIPASPAVLAAGLIGAARPRTT